MKYTAAFVGLALSFIFAGVVYASSPIKVACDKPGLCGIIDVKTKKVLLADLPATPSVKKLSPDTYEIKASCGSPCSASAFYDARKNKISELYPDVITSSLKFNTILFIQDGKIFTSEIFGEKKQAVEIKTTQPLSPTASAVSAIVKAKYSSKDSLSITYMTGNQFKEVTEEIKMKK